MIKLSDYQIRMKWRIKLHSKRGIDQDHSQPRYASDAKLLNRAMRMFKVKGRVATWGKKEKKS